MHKNLILMLFNINKDCAAMKVFSTHLFSIIGPAGRIGFDNIIVYMLQQPF